MRYWGSVMRHVHLALGQHQPIRPLKYLKYRGKCLHFLQTCVQLVLLDGVLNPSHFLQIGVEAPDGVDLVATGGHGVTSPTFLQLGPTLRPLVLLRTIPEQQQRQCQCIVQASSHDT